MSEPKANIEAERRCISCLLKGEEYVLKACADGLTAEHFSQPTARIIFLACAKAAAAKQPVELATVIPHLTDDAGNMRIELGRLVEIEGMEPTGMNTATWVSAVIASASRRRAAKHLTEAVEVTHDTAKPWAEAWAEASEAIGKAQQTANAKKSRSLDDIIDSYIEAENTPEKRRVVGTGLPKWDGDAGMFAQHEFIILAGRPGAGKTALALQVAVNAAMREQGISVVFSLEMRGEELLARLVRGAVGKEGYGDYPAARKLRIEAAERLRKLKKWLHIHDMQEGCDWDTIEAKARLLAATGALSFMVVDYLQLVGVPASARREQRERQVAELSRRMKLLPGQIGCPVMALAQLNRESAKEERLPRKEDLRESGTLEQDADGVWLMAMDPDWLAQQPGDLPGRVSIRLIQDKRRGGRPGIARNIWFDRPRFRFEE